MGAGLSLRDDGKSKNPPRSAGRTGGRLVQRDARADGNRREQHSIVVHMLRRIEDRLDRHDELLISLLQSDHDLERRLRAVERAKEGSMALTRRPA